MEKVHGVQPHPQAGRAGVPEKRARHRHRPGEAGAGAPVRERGGGGTGLRRFPARLRGRLPAGEETLSAGGRRAAADARRKRGGP